MRGTCGGEEMHQEDSSHVQLCWWSFVFQVYLVRLPSSDQTSEEEEEPYSKSTFFNQC